MLQGRRLLAASVSSVLVAAMATATSPAQAAEDEGPGNNLSTPLVFAEGIGLTGQPVATATGLRGTGELLLAGASQVADATTYYLQGVVDNEWQADWVDGLATAQPVTTQADWSDNIVRQTWIGESKVRVEVGLTTDPAVSPPLTGFPMTNLGGTSMDAVWGTTGVPTPSDTTAVYSPMARLTIEKIDKQGGEPMGSGPLFDSAVHESLGSDGPGGFGAEVNAAGTVIYGHLWDLAALDLASIGLPAKPKFGWYRFTFSLDDTATLPGDLDVARHSSIASLNPLDLSAETEGEEGGGDGGAVAAEPTESADEGGVTRPYYKPDLVDERTTRLDVYIASSKGGHEAPDSTGPGSSASGPRHRTATAVPLSWSATDDTALGKVTLFAKGPRDAGFTAVTTDDRGWGLLQAAGSFTYTATEGDGDYAFYTVATDVAGNTEAVPAAPDVLTSVDTSGPSSTVSTPQYATSAQWRVGFTADDSRQLATVDLYVQGPRDSAPVLAATATDVAGKTHADGAFTYTATEGDGTYLFFTRAADDAGNQQPRPATPWAATMLDRAAPESSAFAPGTTSRHRFTVRYRATDPVSGPAELRLYVKRPGMTRWLLIKKVANPAAEGAFVVRALAGPGPYRFATATTDRAGNVERMPLRADAVTRVRFAAPWIGGLRVAPAQLSLSERHRARLTFTVSERSRVRATVRLHDRLVSRLGPVDVTAGPVTLRWRCRDRDGALVEPGRYRIRVRVTDGDGNATTGGAWLRVTR